MAMLLRDAYVVVFAARTGSMEMITVSRLSFWILILLTLFYIGQLVHATLIAATTEPAACKISTGTFLPSPLCPGLDWGQHTRFLLSLPGAYLSYPIEIGFRTTNPLVYANPQFIIIMLIHFFGWGYGSVKLVSWLRRRTNRPDITSR